MRLALLSGARKNAGDFLIVQRCKELLQYVYPNCEIEEFLRLNDLSDVLEQINRSDCLIMAGGPVYRANIYPKELPLVANLELIKVPFFALALGWKSNFEANNKYRYSFGKKMSGFLNRMEADGFPLGCRDLDSVSVLYQVGIQNTLMTGCSAWFNFPFINKKISNSQINKICISDPANPTFFQDSLQLATHIKKRYPTAKIYFVFHSGTDTVMTQLLESAGITSVDISGGVEALSIYDDCDFHIGYRVHAHIYMLSRRSASLLIEEDSRGEGVNKTLGLASIKAADTKALYYTNRYVRKCITILHGGGYGNQYLLQEVDDWLRIFEKYGEQYFEWAFERMRFYFGVMLSHIRLIGERLD
jgi:hypothetical protein